MPSKVVHSLTDGCGSELYELVDRYADASLSRLPDGQLDAQAWASVGQLGDLWETGMVGDLACEALSPTELAEGDHGLSYHQVNRRAGLFEANGLLTQWESPGRRRCYALTEKTRRKMGLLAGIARWRHRHVVAEDEEGMTAPEMATVLRAALRLVTLPGPKEGACVWTSSARTTPPRPREKRSGPRSKPMETSTAAPVPQRTRTAGQAARLRPGSRSSSTAARTRWRSAARRSSCGTASKASTRPSGPPPPSRPSSRSPVSTPSPPPSLSRTSRVGRLGAWQSQRYRFARPGSRTPGDRPASARLQHRVRGAHAAGPRAHPPRRADAARGRDDRPAGG